MSEQPRRLYVVEVVIVADVIATSYADAERIAKDPSAWEAHAVTRTAWLGESSPLSPSEPPGDGGQE